MIRSTARLGRLASACFLAALALDTGDAFAARALRAELLARQPAAAGQPAMSSLALEACLRRAAELDRTGTAIDYEVAEIDRLAAEGMFLQRQLDSEIPMVGGYDEAALKDFQRRVIHHDSIAKQFQREFPLYKQRQKDYDAAVVEFDRDCSIGFSAADLITVKAKLGIK
jgi:hypothetical protein